MRVRRYRGRHLKAQSRTRGPVVMGTVATVWLAGPAARAATHVVSPGETLSGIAARYGTTTSRLAAANNLSNPNLIIAGQRLRVPARLTMNSLHTVQPGETLSSIAARYGTSIAPLARVNKLSNPNLIIAGAQLKVPAGVTIAPASPSPRAATAPAPVAVIEAALAGHAASHRVDSSLVMAVAHQESGWQQDVVSSARAVGVMQVMPATARYINESLGGHNLNFRVADDNVHLGVMYLRHLLHAMPTENKALAAYYSGPGNVGKRLDAGQRHYAHNVQALRSRYR